mmetsp:Transcript_11915/g.24186  ORF Transcript_11915/g.24186 Transcript_11915/m.24186 type:complete len:214 (-) Transcript_11915:421-1062(-)
MGNALTSLGGGGSCILIAFCSISSLNFSPISPSFELPYESARQASVHLPDTSRITLLRSCGGVFCMRSQRWMKPACFTSSPVLLAIPPSAPPVRFLDPSTCSTVEGSDASLSSPPAAPISLAATCVPTMAERLGATEAILDSTKASIFCLWLESFRICSHASCTFCSAASGSAVPAVVDAVTVTTMIDAEGKMPVRSTCVRSVSLPSFSTTRA